MGAPHCSGFSCCEAWAPGAQASSVVAVCGLGGCHFWALEHKLSSCGAGAQLFLGMWDLLVSGIEAVSSALAGGFFTTEPPGKPLTFIFN